MNILIPLFFIFLTLTPIILKIFIPQSNLFDSFLLSSLRFLKILTPLQIPATKKINKNSSIAELFNFDGQFIAVNSGGTALEFVAAPSGGGSSGKDVYSFTIIKVASTGTGNNDFTVIANLIQTS